MLELNLMFILMGHLLMVVLELDKSPRPLVLMGF